MPLSQSLMTAQTSLRAHQQRMDVIANNVANVNTIGYKASRAQFAEHIVQRISFGRAPTIAMDVGGLNPLQIGTGVVIGSILADMSQGPLGATDRPLDAAIRGDGFFVVRYYGQQRFTRAGSFGLDPQGNLVEMTTGALVQGYNALRDGGGRLILDPAGRVVLSQSVETLRVPPGLRSPARQTEYVRLSGNISREMTAGESFSTSGVIYDSAGRAHVLQVEFRSTTMPGEFAIALMLDGRPVQLPASSSSIRFAANGLLEFPMVLRIPASELNAALGGNSAVFDPGRSLTVELAPDTNRLAGVTNFAGQSTVSIVEQDGYAAGELLGISIDATGKLLGSFSNGRTEVLGQVAIASSPILKGCSEKGGLSSPQDRTAVLQSWEQLGISSRGFELMGASWRKQTWISPLS
ncbi:MAG: flagellar hook-basal body complex protein [Candidatus Kapabacteria bacterium]|nr:flagellar hook-basal body complex protein [Candidatus Kapabacteria bacterium]MDW8011497.1 flagellar hook-basal body complex protein [Bacteroidota bacterium]